MVNKGLLRCLSLFLAAVMILGTAGLGQSNSSDAYAQAGESLAEQVGDLSASSYIMKWKDAVDPAFWHETELLTEHEELGVFVVRPMEGIDIADWFTRWSQADGVAYLQTNQKVTLLAAPNDDQYKYQSHLKQIEAPKGWDVAKENTAITIALIDTGVDLDHPDLKSNLIGGMNLIDKSSPPMDDHGHGTNVAGVIGAVGNNGVGVSGVVWKAKIMPIKALEQSGQGEEDKLGEGIRYAVDNGAKIVVMSVGLYRYSPFLREITEYAEQKGVLLVSATGNDGRDIKYPAAYPTVLAVGGVDFDNVIMLESNYGPELDLVAPWTVFTTALGSQYGYNQGTSMAAPQVAGAAALVLAKYPLMKPYEVRSLLRQTAQDLGPSGWDPNSGYGLLRVDKALTEANKVDMFKPNDKRASAKILPVDTEVYGELTSGSDSSWFYLDPKNKGTVTLRMADVSGTSPVVPNVRAIYYPGDSTKAITYEDIVRNPPTLSVAPGKSRIQLQVADPAVTGSFRYKLAAPFLIYRDDFEDNDRQYKAYTLPGDQGALKGTFHLLNDEDWFSLNVRESGSLWLETTPDSMRMDVAVTIQKAGEKPLVVDSWAEGEKESVAGYDLMPGRYYIMIQNVISDEAYPVNGEYELKWRVAPKLIDPNEPNDKLYQATRMVPGTEYQGLIDTAQDVDWFTFTVAADSYARLRLQDIPEDRLLLMTLYDSSQTQLAMNINTQKQTMTTITQTLKKGTYYLKLAASKPFTDRMYRLDLQLDELVAGLRDIKGHWAEQQIAQLAKSGDVLGYGDLTFRPESPITRAEAATMLVRVFGLSGGAGAESFSDVPTKSWSYGAIASAVKAGMVSGYKDGTFRPDKPITRAELAAMVARGAGLQAVAVNDPPRRDVPADHWAAGFVKQLLDKKLLTGYPDGTFHPGDTATRGEMAVVIVRLKGD